jgi:hypothetical protein
MNKLQEGPPLLATTEDWKSFWDFIATWGGSWMWHDIGNVNKPKDNIQRIAEGMTAGTLVWTTDGSYDRKRAADLLGVGWIVFCKTTGRRITGSFWEQSTTASSFGAEMLGLCTLHILAQAVTEYYNIGKWSATMCCNNKRALLSTSHHKGRIRPSAKFTDIRRSFWPLSKHTKEDSSTSTYTDKWTNTYRGCNSVSCNNSTAFATLWQKEL